MINWPALIKHAEDAELDYVEDLQAWESDSERCTFDYDESDYMIDSTGAVFSLVAKTNRNRVVPEPTGEYKSLEQVLGLVKAHAAQADFCCVAKLFAPSIVDAMAMVKALNSQDQ